MFNLQVILSLSLVIAFVIGIVAILIYIPQMRPVITMVVCCAIIISGAYCAYLDFKYLNEKNLTIGQVIDSTFNKTTIEPTPEKDDQTKAMSWDLSTLGFAYVSGTKYQASVDLPYNSVVDFENNKYVILINGEECFKNTCGGTKENPYIKSEYKYQFLDNENNIIFSDTLYINMSFYKTKSTLQIYTNNGEQAVSLWQAYKSKNGFNLSIENSNSIFDSDDVFIYPLVKIVLSDSTEITKYNIPPVFIVDSIFDKETCSKIEKIYLSEGVKSLYVKGNVDFNSLNELHISSTVNDMFPLSIFSSIFNYSPLLAFENVYFDSGNENFLLKDNCVLSKDSKKLYYSFDGSVPDYIESTSIRPFSDNISIIDFSHCKNFVLLSSSIKDYTSLTDIWLPESTSINLSSSGFYYRCYFLSGCPNLERIHFGGSTSLFNRTDSYSLKQLLLAVNSSVGFDFNSVEVICSDGSFVYTPQNLSS